MRIGNKNSGSDSQRLLRLIHDNITSPLHDADSRINGESLGQVASQTLESITVTNDTVKTMPIFRPLIGMDKQEIINIAEKMGTYETSILPYEDCCTVFLPENPVTRPTISKTEEEEKKILNYDELLSEAFDNLELLKVF